MKSAFKVQCPILPYVPNYPGVPYRPKNQPPKVSNLFRKAWPDQKGTHDDPPSFLLSPILPLQHVQFVNSYNIENYRLLHYVGKLLTIFCDKNTANITF